jgi:hypothetical protein
MGFVGCVVAISIDMLGHFVLLCAVEGLIYTMAMVNEPGFLKLLLPGLQNAIAGHASLGCRKCSPNELYE